MYMHMVQHLVRENLLPVNANLKVAPALELLDCFAATTYQQNAGVFWQLLHSH